MLSNEAPDARPVRKFTIQDAQDCMEWSGVSLGGVINEDETPGGKLGGIGFSRAPKGATKNFEFAYDEVLVNQRQMHRPHRERDNNGSGE
jgi:hypothetical protein